MYAYFIDDLVYEKHHRTLDKLDLLLTQQGVSGRKIKLSRLFDINVSIKDCIASGIKTLVAVGNDATASRLLNHALSLKKREDFSFTFCVVPVGAPNKIARLFDIQNIPDAVNALAAHHIRTFDVGLLNQRHYFITSAIFPKKTALRFHSYTVSSLHPDHHISICNGDMYHTKETIASKKFIPDDGILEAVIAYRPSVSLWSRLRGKNEGGTYQPESFFPIKKIIIKGANKTVSIFADTEKQLTSPIEAVVVSGALEAIINFKAQ